MAANAPSLKNGAGRRGVLGRRRGVLSMWPCLLALVLLRTQRGKETAPVINPENPKGFVVY